ncbi:MAG: class I SAM-dependent methyltransferase [Acidobacteriota bacterium]|nr:class I SAM-dependent methyltransferase [Acidobacteriota bacterium]
MQDIPAQTTYWDRVAYDKRFSHPLRVEWLEQYLENPQARILDYGCGYGRTLADLSHAGYTNSFGVDFSEAMLTRAMFEKPGERKLIRNDGRYLSFKSESFDAVFLFAVLTCMPKDSEQRLLLSETNRVLRPGGLIYVSDLLVNDDRRNLERYQRDAETYGCYGVFKLPEGVVVRHHTKEWIEEVTNQFERLEYEPFEVNTMNGNRSAAFQYLGRKPAHTLM